MIERAKTFLSPLALITVVIPTLVALLYFGLLAQDVYISEARVVVRNPDTKSASPLTIALDRSGFGSANESNASVIAYLQSRDAIAEGNEDGRITQAYSNGSVFWFDRFGSLGGTSEEEFYDYFADKLSVTESEGSEVLIISVRAFDPEDAQAINARMVEQAERLVNSLSARSQADLIEVAQGEVDEATDTARLAALELSGFRDTSGIVDPEQQSEAGLQMIGKLQDELIAAQTRLRQLQTYTPQASQVPFLQVQVRELQSEIARERSALTGSRSSLSASMAKYQELQINVDFAEKQLAVARAGLQDARAEARRQQAYLELISAPSLPDYAVEPRRLRSIFATLALGLLAWGVLSMLLIGVREHRD